MGFRHPVSGSIARWVVLPQGTKQSPAYFCSMTEAAARIFNRICKEHGVACQIFVYVDDFIFVADTAADLDRAFELTDAEAFELGLSWNPSKDVGRGQCLRTIDALGLTINASELTLSLPADKRSSYLQCLQEFSNSYRAARTCPRKPLEQLLGKLVFACRVCRWGYLFVQSIMDVLYPGHDAHRHRQVELNDAVWNDLQFWLDALGPAYSTWMGVKQAILDTKEVAIKQENFQLHVYSDASKRFGVGGVACTGEVYSAQWDRDVTPEHIGSLELEALLWNLRHWQHKLHRTSILAWLDNTQAVEAVNKGASRIPALRKTLLEIALLGLQHNFVLRAKYIKGEDNPADAPSRGRLSTSAQEFTFLDFERFNSPPAEVDCCAGRSGAQPGCTLWYTADELSANADQLTGKVLWANIPFSAANESIGVIVAAWIKDPLHTVATLVVPDWPTALWYRKYLRRKQPFFRLLQRYPAGSILFSFKSTGKLAPPTKVPILILRIGGRTGPHAA
jgi:hypothetical protein